MSTVQRMTVIAGGVGALSQVAIVIVKRGVAVAQIWNPRLGRWAAFRMFLSPTTIAEAQMQSLSGFRGWLLENTVARGRLTPLERLIMRSNFSAAGKSGVRFVERLLGRNLTEFLATRMGAFLAVGALVASAMALSQGGVPMAVAANALFLTASALETVATVGAWAVSAFRVGAMAVSRILAVIPYVGWVVFLAGVVLQVILMFQPQQTAVEKFAHEQAGPYFMPYKTDIDYFQEYQASDKPQRAGVAVRPASDLANCLYVEFNGQVAMKPFDASGNSAFYLRVDELGRAQFGAPILNENGELTLRVLALDGNGNLVAAPSGEDPQLNKAMLWRAALLSAGTYEDGNLHAGNFMLYNEGWAADHGVRRYISVDATSGWTVRDGQGSTLLIEMVTTKPGDLRMANVAWYTYEHDQRQGPVLGVVGSAPRHWTLQPALPPGLLFFEETGVIAMEIGVDVPPAPLKEYNLTVTNAAGSTSTVFTLEVHAAGPFSV